MFGRIPLLLLLFACLIKYGLALWCFECTSSTPGCGENFNWWMHWTRTCPESDDVCVKIVDEHRGRREITRACLSTIGSTRRDIPPDHYEGCRPGVADIKLANYVNHSIAEHDIRRTYYNSTWCFCYFDLSCNRSTVSVASGWLFLLSTILVYVLT